ncbi:MAG: bacillithiol biosynthesis deacetylase BshB1 [Limnochordales bacterium]|nr:bacillithiol biosynthesis deacetylase BshB1 [Limnochordales bacterium]
MKDVYVHVGDLEPVDILAVGAHPDDVEIAMAGTILVAEAEGFRVGVVDLTNGEPTPFGSVETRMAEARAAAAALGVVFRATLPFPNRYLQDTREVREMLAGIIRLTRPRWLFVHYWEDAHPDHLAAQAASEAARFYTKLTRVELAGEPYWPERVFHFFSTHIRKHPDPDFIVDISSYLDRKLEILRLYESQFVTGRPNNPFFDTIATRARYFGGLIGRVAGEPFVTREKIGLASLRGLI